MSRQLGISRRKRFLDSARNDRLDPDDWRLALVSCGILDLTARRWFEPENGFTFLHQVEAIARDRFQIRRIGLYQSDFVVSVGEQFLLLINTALQIVDFRAALHGPFVRWDEQANDDEPDGEHEEDTEDAIEALPNGGFATRSKIAVSFLHLSAS